MQAPAEPPSMLAPETSEEAPAEILTEAPEEPTSPPAETPTTPAAVTSAANLPVPPSSPPAVDWDLLYLIVRKVVLKMSPPALSREAAEELARRLADETAFELSAELPSPEP